jgi:uncharacterized peroxidase-related enzyme
VTEPRRPQAWVATVPPEAAVGRLKEAYDWQSERLGEPTEFTQLGSLHPELVYERLRLYKVVDNLESGLSDAERQIVIFLTSALNETPHCASGAQYKMHVAGVDDDLVQQIMADPFAPATGDRRLDAIVEYTAVLTRSPGDVTEGHIEQLRAGGLSDADIVALNNLSAYFCYTNRVATGLGLRSEIPAEHAAGAAPR